MGLTFAAIAEAFTAAAPAIAGGAELGAAAEAGIGAGALGAGAAGAAEGAGALGAGALGAGAAGDILTGGAALGLSPEVFGAAEAAQAAGAGTELAGATGAANLANPSTFVGPTLPAVSPSGAGGTAAGLAGPTGASAANLADPATFVGPTLGPDAGTAAAGKGAADAGGGGVGDLISKLGKGAVDNVTKNPLGLALGAAPLVSQLINPPKVPQQQGLTALQQQQAALADQQANLSKTLTDPLVSGKLPAGAEQSVQNSINDAISTTKARYASLGLSGSTMEADAIANIQNQATGIRAQIAEQMAQTGQSAASGAATAYGLQDQVYTQLMNAQMQQDQALQTAIAKFAAAAGGAPNSVSLKLA